MRKRRRLANKLTIMVCAVLCAVSAFFYVPMDVSASSSSGSLSATVSENAYRLYAGVLSQGIGTINFYETALDNVLYEVDLNVSANVDLSLPLRLVNFVLNFNGKPLIHGFFGDGVDGQSYLNSYSYSRDLTVYLKGSELKSIFVDYSYSYYAENSGSFVSDIVFDYLVKSVTPLSASDSNDYQDGYNAGYSAGEQAGYGNGYSNGFADGEASVDTNDIYNQGFEAGKDSVDMQSYYDAGYQAGYDAAYSEGYESGYDVGYQSAMDRIDSWGADTSDYPKLVNSGTFNDIRLDGALVSENQTLVYDDYMVKFTNNFNPFHVYKVVVNVSDVNFFSGPDGNYREDYVPNYIGYLTVLLGSNTYKLDTLNSWIAEYYISGEEMSNLFTLRSNWNTSAWHDSDNGVYPLGYAYCEISEFVVELYDMGPTGDTQNHIANQTDQLTNGFDESQGNSVNNDLSSGLNEYQTAEDSLWATATTGLKDFTFFDFESVPAMITGMSFITSIMGKWFNEAGGASGVGIVLSILFSVMLVSMVLGLYRLYQSSARRAEFRQIHKESMERWKRGK